MILCKVTGTLVSTVKIPALEGQKLLIVHPVSLIGEISGSRIVAVDTVQAGIGDTVLIIDEGGSAGIVLGKSSQPIRAVIVAIVDELIITC